MSFAHTQGKTRVDVWALAPLQVSFSLWVAVVAGNAFYQVAGCTVAQRVGCWGHSSAG